MNTLNTRYPALSAVSQIVRAYRGLRGQAGQPASLRTFAEQLSQGLAPVGGHISHQSVKNWLDRRHLPDAFLMRQLARAAPGDWRAEFALDILAALDPANQQPASPIGLHALASAEEIQLSSHPQ